jgi:soluble lytic murein transglycosylase-like protein
MRRAFLLTTLLLASCAQAQSLSEYLKLRKSSGITQPVTVATLDSLVGTKIVEVAGLVKGSFRVGDKGSIMVERSSGGVTVIECETVPAWLVGNEVRARLLVKASREAEGFELNATLLGAAPEADIAAYDKKSTLSKAAPKPILTSRSAPRTVRRDWTLPASQVTPLYAAYIKKVNPRLTNEEALEIATGVIGFSMHYKVDARLIMAMVIVESGFNPNATSRSGAQGLGQLMPGTASGLGVRNSYDSIENLYGTVKLVRGHLDTYKKQTGEDFEALVLALAAYNAGGGAVRRHGGVPPYRETQNYVRKVILTYQKLAGY